MPLPLPEPSEEHLTAVLEQLGVIHFDEVIFEMGRRKLRRHFSHNNGSLHESLLLSNLIWQDLGFIRDGTLPLFIGNLRSYWYIRAKPTLDRAGATARALRETLDDLTGAKFAQFVGDLRLFAYREFGFADSSAHLRRIGSDNPHIIVVAEKEGQLGTISLLARRFGCTIIALGGHPSLSATEHFANALHDGGLAERELLVMTLVDFDPAGDSIATSFINQLRQVGFIAPLERVDMALPQRMSTRQIALNKYSLGRKRKLKTKKENWWQRTGGGLFSINPRWKNYGLEADAMTWEQIEAAFVELAAGHMEVPVEQIERRRIKAELASVLERHLIERLTGPML